jgi:hypothetical protein
VLRSLSPQLPAAWADAFYCISTLFSALCESLLGRKTGLWDLLAALDPGSQNYTWFSILRSPALHALARSNSDANGAKDLERERERPSFLRNNQMSLGAESEYKMKIKEEKGKTRRRLQK